jgi:REP element-mobilizing transposase RayT
MSRPRQILPGASYLITRGCANGRFLLRPSEATNEIFLYVLAVAVRRTGVVVHSCCVMSTHYHLAVTDPRGRLPRFLQYLNALVAKAMNREHKRTDHFWAGDGCSVVVLETPHTVLAKMAYVLANPVKAGLVSRGHEWPGLWLSPSLANAEAIDVVRPKPFFRAAGPLPPVISLRVERPAGFVSAGAFDTRLAERVALLEERAARRLALERRAFRGVAAVLRQDPRVESAPCRPRSRLKPRVACLDRPKRIAALRRLARFAADYGQALAAWRDGVRDVLFPAGTYQLHVDHGACCAGAG